MISAPRDDLWECYLTLWKIIEPVIKAFARDLVNALTYLHSNGIVFCDLKPKNIILNEYSEIKLCDFALCQRIVDMIVSPLC